MLLPVRLLPLLLWASPAAAAASPTAAVVIEVDPLRTSLAVAQNAARHAMARPGACGVQVRLAPGRHKLPPGGLQLDSRDSGHGSGCEAVWSGPGAVISGGRPVDGPWVLHDRERDIWAAALPAGLTAPGPRQLYAGGDRAVRARSPVNTSLTHKHGMNGQWIPGCLINSSNSAACNFTVTTTGFILQTAAPLPSAAYCPPPSTARNYTCELEMAWTGRADAWNAPRCPVRGVISTPGKPPLRHTTEFVMAQPCWENGAFKKGHVGAIRELPVYLENAVGLIEKAGDFATSNGKVYFKPWLRASPPEDAEVPNVMHLLRVDGAEHLRFEDMAFEKGGWLEPSTGDGFIDVQAAHRLFGNATFAPHCQLPLAPGLPPGHGGPPCAAPTPAHVSVRAGKHLAFTGVTFRQMGAVALNVTGGSQNVIVDSCHFHNVSGNAIGLGQTDDWRETEPSKQNARLTVRNCTLRNVTQEFGGSVGIFVGFVRDSEVTQTTIDSPAKACISLGWGWGSASPSYMRNNSITRNLCLRGNSACCGGMGVIYTLGAQPNTTLAYNFVHDAARVWAGVGFHHDEGSAGISDHANVVFNAPALDKIHVTYGLMRNGSHNMSNPLTKDISVTDSWTNTRPLPDSNTGPPGNLVFRSNQFINTTAGERWPQAALNVMREAGSRSASVHLDR
jgi:hypothetical protein